NSGGQARPGHARATVRNGHAGNRTGIAGHLASHPGPAQSLRPMHGKGAKERAIPIHDQAVEAVVDYLEEGRPLLVRNRDEPALFVNRRGERLTRQGFWLILKGYAKSANLSPDITPHTLRHSFATHMLSGGLPLPNV